MTYIHIHAPKCELFCMVNPCPTCERDRRMLGSFAEWYGVTWTCLGCGDQWQDGWRLERPFSRGWRQVQIRYARKQLASIGVQA